MPLYEYRCAQCGEKQELIVRSADAAQAPDCSGCGRPMEKVWAPIGACKTSSANSCAPRGGFS